MTDRTAKAEVLPIRQRTQYSCMATSMTMCLQALGHECNEDEVNKVMGATPMKGAAWEHALATAQHYGCRATLTSPCTVPQLKEWTDRGVPVMIAWNPEGREWSHASVVFDVDDQGNVHVADPNIPDPEETVRVVPKGEFYKKWYEKWPRYLVRRPAMAIEREISPEGRQMRASQNLKPSAARVATMWQNASREWLEELRLSVWSTLERLGRPASIKELSKAVSTSDNSVRTSLKKLEREGLVRRKGRSLWEWLPKAPVDLGADFGAVITRTSEGFEVAEEDYPSDSDSFPDASPVVQDLSGTFGRKVLKLQSDLDRLRPGKSLTIHGWADGRVELA